MTDQPPQKATWLPGGEPPAPVAAPVAAPDRDKPRGERQDGADTAPPRPERNDATPVGATAAARRGARQGGGPSDDPFAAERGEPATFATGAARGSGAGGSEEPDPDGKSNVGGGKSD